VNQLPLATIGTAVGTALLPTLSRQALAGEAQAAISTLNRALEYALTLTLPAALALMVVPGPIIAVLFGRGAFDAQTVALSAQALAAYAAGLPAFVLVKLLVSGFFARGDTAMPVRIGIACVVFNLALNLAFMVPFQHLGPPMASTVSAWANVAVLSIVLMRRGHLAVDAQLARRVPRMVLAGLVMVGALYGLRIMLFDAGSGLRWIALGALVTGGIVAYGVAGEVLGAFTLREMAQGLRRRKRG
jgi:putative peptidoglycan lipid II flippase